MKTTQILILFASCIACLTEAQLQKRPDPVPILKQISKQNDDGSYTFGYEAGDGSFKIETKHPNGDVQGKYGYVDESGKLREVEYGASSKRGFEPQGNDINVPPPTLNEVVPGPLGDGEEDDGQYREDPSIYDTKEYKSSHPPKKVAASRRPVFQQTIQQPAPQPQEQYQPTYYQQPSQTFGFQQPLQSFSQYQQPSFSGFQQARSVPSYQQPQYQQQQYQQPQYQQPQYQQSQYRQDPYTSQYFYNGHPSVKNFDLGSGSYSINY